MPSTASDPSAALRVLVAYASRHGSTHEVATAISDVLRERGLVVDVQAARDVHDLTGFDAVVIGPGASALPLSHMPAVDARDWDAVRSWAVELADQFATAGRRVPT